MTPTTLAPSQIAHHIKGIRPALMVMADLGVDAATSLKNTGIRPEQLDDPSAGITLQQEFVFYQNLLRLSDSPLIGLKLGQAYRLETYGLLGYALLSAQTMGECLALITDLGALTFTHFSLQPFEEGDLMGLALCEQYPLPTQLLQVYSDRDVQAAFTAFHQQGLTLPAMRIRLMHNSHQHLDAYRAHFQCPVSFGHKRNEILFDKSLLDAPLPQRDMETSSYCREQCKRLLEKLSRQGSFIDKVRQLIVASPGYFPTVDEVAAKLDYTARSLRRHLEKEGSSYQKLLNEIRWELARNYLQTDMPIEQIADMLGYGETCNFSHAFKRWQGVSPKEFRQQCATGTEVLK